jgi:hypothetical protein
VVARPSCRRLQWPPRRTKMRCLARQPAAGVCLSEQPIDRAASRTHARWWEPARWPSSRRPWLWVWLAVVLNMRPEELRRAVAMTLASISRSEISAPMSPRYLHLDPRDATERNGEWRWRWNDPEFAREVMEALSS